MPLRPFSSRMFPDAVTLRPVTHAAGDRGGDDASPDAGIEVPARVLEVTRASREDGDGQAFGVHTYEVTTPADPSLSADDRVDWRGRALSPLAPAVDVGGEGRRWRMYCREVS